MCHGQNMSKHGLSQKQVPGWPISYFHKEFLPLGLREFYRNPFINHLLLKTPLVFPWKIRMTFRVKIFPWRPLAKSLARRGASCGALGVEGSDQGQGSSLAIWGTRRAMP